jgi:plastocyanin
MTMRALSRRTLLGLLAAASTAPGRGGAATERAEIAIEDFAFRPAQLEIVAGRRVAWINHDDAPHLVVATGGAFRSGALDTGDAFAFVFREPGRYDYFCSLHPHMRGVVTVLPVAGDGAEAGDD